MYSENGSKNVRKFWPKWLSRPWLIVVIQFRSERVAFEDLIWPLVSKLPIIETELLTLAEKISWQNGSHHNAILNGLLQKPKRTGMNRKEPVQSNKITLSKYPLETIWLWNLSNRDSRTASSGDRSEAIQDLEIWLVLVRSEIWKIFSVLVRSQVFLVRACPRLLKFLSVLNFAGPIRSCSFWGLGPRPTGFGPWTLFVDPCFRIFIKSS